MRATLLCTGASGCGSVSVVVDRRPAGPVVRRPGALSGRQKAAVLLVSVGPEGAAEVFGHLGEDEIETLSLEMAKLEHLDPVTTDAVHQELVAMVAAYESFVSGGIDYAREVLERSLGGERAAEIMGRLSSVIEKRPFEFLRCAPPDQIVTFLQHESPQVVAVVVAHLPATLAGQVLSQLPEAVQSDTALRIAQMGAISPEVVRGVEKRMRQNFAGVAEQEHASVRGVESLAQILVRGDRSTERNVLDGLAECDEELAAEVRQLLFTFEDISRLDDRTVQLVVREADHKDLALALRGTGEDLKQRILANMSTRGAQMLVEELEVQPPQRRRVIDDAQGRIVAIVRRLEDAGAIVITRGPDDAVV
jgi:flagellar motor switch protein FliG